ncbi:MAG: hypothetical protein KF799_04675 [Bdellovibrionales bacterium]|nr:hypothetical protein [Bdellovibrionales bacterium]
MTTKKTQRKPVRSPDVPATAAMLYEMEGRLQHQMNAGFERVKAEFSIVRADLSSLKSELHRIGLLVEEQNARNKYVLDGYAQLYELILTKLA